MYSTSSDQLRAEGAAARARGVSILDNPLYRTQNLPDLADKEFRQWEAQAAAWETGWREGVPRTGAKPESGEELGRQATSGATFTHG